MNGFRSYYLADKLNDLEFGGVAWTPPATLYCAASTTTPNPDGTGVTEPVGNGYARAAVTNDASHFGPSVNGVTHNLADILFPAATGPQGTITYLCWYDAPSGGNMLRAGPIAPRVVAAGDILTIKATTGFTGRELTS
jgi:hypothetical protein